MNIYYCDTCGARIPDSESLESEGVRYCEKHRPAPVESIPVAPRSGASKSKLTPAGRTSGTMARPMAEAAPKKPGNAVLFAGALGLGGAAIIAIFLFSGKTAVPKTSEAPSHPQKQPDAHPAPVVENKIPVNPAPEKSIPVPLPVIATEQNDLYDIRESAAKHQLEDIQAYEKSAKAEPYTVRRRYMDFVSSSYKGTRAAAEAQERLKELPVVAPPKPAVAASDGLVLHFNFSEGNGNLTTDCSGNGRNGTLKNASWTTGKAGGAVEFSTRDSYVVVEDTKDVGSAYTTAVWVRAERRGNAQSIMARRATASEKSLGYMLRIPTDGLASAGFRTGDAGAGVWVNSRTRIDDNKWHHVASTFDGKSLLIFVDGKQDGLTTANKKPIGAEHSPLVLGNDAGYPENQLKGALSDVRIYNRALSAEEIAALVSAESAAPVPTSGLAPPPAPSVVATGEPDLRAGLAAHWKFNEGSGSTAKDSSGNGCDGTLENVTWAEGKTGGAAEFKGKGCIRVSKSTDLTKAFTLAAWVKSAPAEKRPQRVFARRDSKDKLSVNFLLSLNTNGAVAFRLPETADRNRLVYSNQAVTDGQWHHIAATYDGTTVTMHVDGKADKSITNVAAPSVRGNPALTLGDDPLEEGQGFIGLLDDVRIYSRALSEKEIAALAAAAP